METGADGAGRRHPCMRVLLPQHGPEFFGSPSTLLSAQAINALEPQLRQSMRAAMRRPRQFPQGGNPAAVITVQPMITRFSADAPNLTYLCHDGVRLLNGKNKSKLLLQRKANDLWHMRATECVTYVPGLKCYRCSRFMPSDAPYPSPWVPLLFSICLRFNYWQTKICDWYLQSSA